MTRAKRFAGKLLHTQGKPEMYRFKEYNVGKKITNIERKIL